MDIEKLLQLIEEQGMRLAGGLAVLVAGLVLVHWVMKLVSHSERFLRIEPTVKGFLHNVLKLILYATVVLTAAGVMGIPLTTFVTIIASAGVAISLAMQGALTNFVGGMLILVLKMFRSGDYVIIGDIQGTVQSIGVLYTELVTLDNRHISLPNSSLTNTAVINCSREGTRRMEARFGVHYASDMERVRLALLASARRTSGVLETPEPEVHLESCGDSSLNFIVLAWCRGSDYWPVYWGLRENGKRALDEAGIEIPYPQLDVHMKPDNRAH